MNSSARKFGAQAVVNSELVTQPAAKVVQMTYPPILRDDGSFGVESHSGGRLMTTGNRVPAPRAVLRLVNSRTDNRIPGRRRRRLNEEIFVSMTTSDLDLTQQFGNDQNRSLHRSGDGHSNRRLPTPFFQSTALHVVVAINVPAPRVERKVAALAGIFLPVSWRLTMEEKGKNSVPVQNAVGGTPFKEMSSGRKTVFICKLVISILTFGFAFPDLMND